jgi:hypothetical protein
MPLAEPRSVVAARLTAGRGCLRKERPGPDPHHFCILFAFIGTFTYVNFVLIPGRDTYRRARHLWG